eukprot:1610981-Pleurochrysis_carterae.AAC.3
MVEKGLPADAVAWPRRAEAREHHAQHRRVRQRRPRAVARTSTAQRRPHAAAACVAAACLADAHVSVHRLRLRRLRRLCRPAHHDTPGHFRCEDADDKVCELRNRPEVEDLVLLGREPEGLREKRAEWHRHLDGPQRARVCNEPHSAEGGAGGGDGGRGERDTRTHRRATAAASSRQAEHSAAGGARGAGSRPRPARCPTQAQPPSQRTSSAQRGRCGAGRRCVRRRGLAAGAWRRRGA